MVEAYSLPKSLFEESREIQKYGKRERYIMGDISDQIFLAGDIGGTSTRLGLYEKRGDELVCLYVGKFRSQKGLSLADFVNTFLEADLPRPVAACFGVPGPVFKGTVTTTNLPWELSEPELVTSLKIPHVKLVNDLAAVAAVVPFLKEEELLLIHQGDKQRDKSVSAVVAPGTGLGQSMVYMDSKGLPHPLPSEGGHVNFAPQTELEWNLMQYLLRTLKRVSVERLLCGPGLYNLYSFLRDERYEQETAHVAERMKTEDPPQVITSAALGNECPLCYRTLELFAQVLGSHAGNVMLNYMATGGVYIGGGIAPKIASFLSHKQVAEAYVAKGRLSPMVRTTPLAIIKDDRAGLHGAARLASFLVD
jgi:glucokinase